MSGTPRNPEGGLHEVRPSPQVARPARLGEPVSPVSAPGGPSGTEWPDPQPIVSELPPVQVFDPGLLPEKLRGWILDIGRRVQCPLDFLAATLMVALATVVGRSIGIRPKQRDDWVVVANLWAAIIGRSGILKTPAIQEILRPLHWLESQAKRHFDNTQKDHEAAALVAEHRKRDSGRRIAQASDADALDIARGILDSVPDAPTRRRFITNDPTVEKLGVLLNENPNGILVYRDELVGLLRSLDKEGHESARAFYLEAWNGTGKFTYDRIGRGTIDIEAATCSIVGSIQPGPLASYLREAVNAGAGDDGLMQRFQLAVWPDVSTAWENVDEFPDSEARKAAFETFARLHAMDSMLAGAEQPQGEEGGIPFLRFTPRAQAHFDEWRAQLERRVRSGTEHPAIESHLSKYRSLIPSIGLLLHSADEHSGSVDLPELDKAIRWGEYLESHARRLYSVAINPDAALAKLVAKKILGGDLKPRFALRDVYRPQWTGLANRDAALRAVHVLVDLDWLAEVRETTPGATRTIYEVNPKVYAQAKGAEGTDRADTSDGVDDERGEEGDS